MRKTILTCCATAVLAASGSAVAGERESLESLRAATLGLIEALVDQGVLDKDKASSLIKSAEQKAEDVAAKPAAGGTVRVQYIPESVKAEIREQIKQEVLAQAKGERWGEPGALPDWLNRIAFEGDVRLRYENDRFDSGNATWAMFPNYNTINAQNGMKIADVLTKGCNSSYFRYNSPDCGPSDNLNRLKLRARLGMTAKINDSVTAGIRVTTTATATSGGGGTINDPLSANQTMGNNFAKAQIAIDQAYIKMQPTEWLSVSGGRIANPWFNTELVWAQDLTFDGIAGTARPHLDNENVKPWLTVGAFPLLDSGSSGSSGRNRWLYAAQSGSEFKLSPRTTARLGVAYYNYTNMHGIPDTAPLTGGTLAATANDYSAAQYLQKGNSLINLRANDADRTILVGLAGDYRLLNITGSLDLAQFDPVHVIFTGDYVKNVGFKPGDIYARTGERFDKRNTGYLGKVVVGMPLLTNKGDWQAEFAYRHLEADAVLDAYADSDFHLGGTDTKGYVLGLSYAIEKNTTMRFRWLSASAIDGPPLGIDVGQVDLNVRF